MPPYITMGEKEDAPPASLENVEIPINIFESHEISLVPAKPKKRRVADEYDYNDPFLEPMEGEYEPVELECKLKNFYVYKGNLQKSAKKTAQQYNREKKKRDTLGIQLSNDTAPAILGPSQDATAVLFDFEKSKDYVMSKPSWAKTDTRLTNFVLWLISTRDLETPASTEAALATLRRADLKTTMEMASSPSPEELVAYYAQLKIRLEELHAQIVQVLSNQRNYSEDGKIFKGFKSNKFMEDLLNFHLLYVKYYAGAGESNMNTARKRATWAVLSAFPSSCTNNIKLKHNVIKEISKQLAHEGFDMEKAAIGEFVKIGDNRETQEPKGHDNNADTSNKDNKINTANKIVKPYISNKDADDIADSKDMYINADGRAVIDKIFTLSENLSISNPSESSVATTDTTLDYTRSADFSENKT